MLTLSIPSFERGQLAQALILNFQQMEESAGSSTIHQEQIQENADNMWIPNRPKPNSSPHVSQVRKLLFHRILVGVNDGRFFMGTFHCLDKQGNIILQDAVEYRSTHRSSPSPMEPRCLGLVLIPASCRSSCHVDCSLEEQLSFLSLQK